MRLEQLITEDNVESFPALVVVITGKGPEKDFYMKRVALLKQKGQLPHTHVFSMWLRSEDYPLLLGNFYFAPSRWFKFFPFPLP